MFLDGAYAPSPLLIPPAPKAPSPSLIPYAPKHQAPSSFHLPRLGLFAGTSLPVPLVSTDRRKATMCWTGRQRVQKCRRQVTDRATTDCRLGNDGSRTHANGCNLPMMDLGRATTGLGRATIGFVQPTTSLNRATIGLGEATTDGARAHTSTPVRTYMHPEFIRVGRLVSDTRPYFSCFFFRTCLAEKLCLRAISLACDHLCVRPPLQLTTSAQNHISARLLLRTTTSPRDHIYKRRYVNPIENWAHVFKLTWHPLGI